MDKRSRFRKIMAGLLAAATVFTSLPILSLPAEAATISSEYTYSIKVKNGNIKNAGTNDTVSCLIESVNGNTITKTLDSKADDFERNDCRTYSFSLALQPWEIKKVGLKHSGGYNATHIEWFEFYMPNNQSVYVSTNRWFNREEKKYYVWGSTDRQISSYGNFESEFSGSAYYAPNVTSGQGTKTMTWNGKVKDQYFSEYSIFDYVGAVGLTFEVSGKTYNGKSSIISINDLTDNNLATTDHSNGYDNKLSINNDRLLSYMKTNGIYKLTITSGVRLTDYDQYAGRTANYTVYRTGFELGEAEAISTAYGAPESYNKKTGQLDANFYNQQYNSFTVKVPVKSIDNYNASTIASSLASNIKNSSVNTSVKIYYDEVSTGKYITPYHTYASGAYIYFNCSAPSGFNNEKSTGITVVIENAKATYNGREYTLDRTDAKYLSKITRFKVDTEGLTHNVTDTAGSPINSSVGFDEWAPKHSFKISFSGGELFYDNPDYGKKNEPTREENFFSYKLTDKNGKEVELQKHNGKSDTEYVPHTGNSTVYKIKPANKAEGEYTLEIKSRDYANNLNTTYYPVKLDMMAPRVSVNAKTKTLTDQSKRNEYTFTITDASGTGRLYYAFVRDGYSIPSSTETKPETSGPEDTMFEKWGFIDQKNGVNTVVLTVPDGDFFNGTLYWYTVDDAGNDSRTEKNGGSDKNGYYYTKVSLSNVSADCEIILGDVTPGSPSYDIAFETNELNKVEYRWVGKNVITKTYSYTDSSEPGAAAHRDTSGNSVVLDGTYTLEYTVITPDGSRTTYKRDFTFDNTAPTVDIYLEDNGVSDTQSATVTVKDATNIESIRYQLLGSDGTEIGEMIELDAGRSVVSNAITLTPENTGAYKIRVIAVDINGFTTTIESEVFSIRNAAPRIEILSTNISKEYEGTPITGSQDYYINVCIEEDVYNIDDFEGNQVMVYRTSADGINYSDWSVISDPIKYYGDVSFFSESVILTSPIALNSGYNRLYVQAAFASFDDDLSTIPAELITTNSEVEILYDDAAPQYKLRLDMNGMTNETVTGTITFTDNYTELSEFKIGNSDSSIILGDITETETGGVMEIEITNNVEDGWISLTDYVGNRVYVPINVDCIDITPPDVTSYDNRKVYSGNREDYYLSFFVDMAMDDVTEFALIEGEYGDVPDSTYDPSDTSSPSMDSFPVLDEETLKNADFGPLPDKMKIINEEVEENYPNGETKVRYGVMIYADEEISPATPEPDADDESYYEWLDEWIELNTKYYTLAIKTRDALGNETICSVSPCMSLLNCTATVAESYCIPEIAYQKTALVLNMSVPVYILSDNNIPDYALELNIADGRLDTSNDEDISRFAEFIAASATHYSTEYTLIIDGLGEKDIFFVDETGRVYKETITVKDINEMDPDAEYDPHVVYASFDAEIPAKVSLWRGEYYSDPADWELIDADTIEAFDPNAGYSLYVVIETTEAVDGESTVYLTPEYVSRVINGEDWAEDFYFDYYNSEENADGYSKLVYELCDTTNANKVIAYTATVVTEGAGENGNDLVQTVGSAYELYLKDTTPPEVDVYYSTTGYTNTDVTVDIYASDFQLTVNGDEEDENSPGSDPASGEEAEAKVLTEAELAESLGIENIQVSDIYTDYIYDYEDVNYTDLGKVSNAHLTFTENGYAVVKVTNTLGLVSYTPISVWNIDKVAVEEGVHYNVVYYYTDADGYEQETEADGYYKEVTARIELTNEGYYKGVLAKNNLGSLEKTLTVFDDSFIFELADDYGNTAECTVSFDRFDTVAPTVETTPEVTYKTNSPYSVHINVTDLHSEAGEVYVTDPYGDELETEFIEDIIDGETGIVTKVFAVTVYESGVYSLKATDICDNALRANFTVNNIDTTEPYVAKSMYTTTSPTTQPVGVKLYYSKNGVKITAVELGDGTGLKSSDISVDSQNSVIRFHKNGYVSVWFTDEYGNVGSDIVSVSNIQRTPPSLKAVATLAEDELSISVRFEKNEEETRSLDELYVLHGGITPVATEYDEDGNIVSERILNAGEVEFTFIDNGTYTFYVFDSIGNMQTIVMELDGIDRTAPVITDVSWSYSYMDENGNMQIASYSITPEGEYGYNIVEDETYVATNQDITATVTTDAPTRFVGDNGEYTEVHSIVYDRDGWFNFYLEKPNSLMDSYGLGLYLIDKEAPIIEDTEDLMFFEKNAGADYSKELLSCTAYDVRYDEVTDLTDKVEIDWGGFDPDDISKNVYDKNKPYTITYTVKDSVGNVTVVRRTVTLVGLFDTMIKVNGQYPDSSGRFEVIGGDVEITLDNFGGKAYVRYEKGVHTMAQMKYLGTVVNPENGVFKTTFEEEGWYTFYVQTDLCDYFCVNVYVYNS